MNIVVLAGGLSPERNVSLTSGSLIANALMQNGHRVLLLDVYEGMPTLPDDAEEVEVAKFFHPVEIVDQNRAVFLIVKVDEARHLLLDAVDVVLNRFRRQEFAFVAFAARVADHPGRAADENDRTVPGFLEAA